MWKTIEDGYYQVHPDGKVRNKVTGRILSPFNNGRGYQTVYLYKGNGKRKAHRISRLVAQSFIPNPKGKQFVDHVNRNRSDNRVDNLRWATIAENASNRAKAIHCCPHCHKII